MKQVRVVGEKLHLRNLTNDLPGREESEHIFQGFLHLNTRTPSKPPHWSSCFNSSMVSFSPTQLQIHTFTGH